MFIEHGLASCSFGSMPLALLAVRYATLSTSYQLDNELEGKGGWRNPGPAGKTFLCLSVKHFNSRVCLAEYAVHHVCSIFYSASCYC
jgi:hypothetical protein